MQRRREPSFVEPEPVSVAEPAPSFVEPVSRLRVRVSERPTTGRLAPTEYFRWGRIDARWMIALIALEVLACVLVLVPRGEIASVGSGLGEYAASLATGRGYRMDVPCAQLDHLRRMPLGPAFLAGVAWLGGGIWTAVLVRLGLLLSLLVTVVACFASLHGRSWWRSPVWTGVFLLLAAAPLFAKHLAQLSYEEGFSIVLIPCLMLAGLSVLDPSPVADARRPAWSILFGALLAAVFLLKSGYLGVHVVGVAALLWVNARRPHRLHGLGLIVALAGPLGWAAFVFHASGRLSLGTSWDGENLFRGWSSAGLQVYPWQSLDRLFDTPAIAVPGGLIEAPLAPPRCAFGGEWAWSDHYRDRALGWAVSAPGSAARFILEKARVVLFEVRPVPLSGMADPLRAVVVIASFLLLRGLGLVALVGAIRRRSALGRRLPQLLFGAFSLLALSLPLLVGFAYDRHTFVLLVAFLFLSAGLASRLESSEGLPRAGL
jgi:hypothetical protein